MNRRSFIKALAALPVALAAVPVAAEEFAHGGIVPQTGPILVGANPPDCVMPRAMVDRYEAIAKAAARGDYYIIKWGNYPRSAKVGSDDRSLLPLVR